MSLTNHGVDVVGVQVDNETRCVHYASPTDIVALKFACCDAYYPCYECHLAVADHPPIAWPKDRFDEPMVLCGHCGTQLTANQYFHCDSVCPDCGAAFNPNCKIHTHLYFEG